jgi:hypothetical protein
MELVAAQDCLNSAATSFNLFDKSACVGVAPPRIKVALLMIFMSIKRLSEEVIDTLATHMPAKGFGVLRLREPAPIDLKRSGFVPRGRGSSDPG